jgi:N,N'-diacetyl-8-epilegionaminate cytidylyltransferase
VGKRLKLNNVAFVFARGGSKGIINKNLAKMGNQTLLAHTLQFAIESDIFSEIFLSTDSAEIAHESQKFHGIRLIERPANLATDDSAEFLSWKHAVNFVSAEMGFDYKFVSLACTAPFRKLNSVISGIEALTSDWDLVISMTQSGRSPWFNMVKKTEKGIEILMPNSTAISRRQDSPITYDLTTAFYISWPSYILNSDSLWSGRVNGVEVPLEESIDIDSHFDLLVADTLLNRKLQS